MTNHRLILRINYAALPVAACPSSVRNTRQRFRCWLDDGSPVGPESGLRSPAYDGARALIASGFSPDRLMTTRAASSSCDSWSPASVASFARLAVYEPDGFPPQVAAFSSRPPKGGNEKQGNALPSGGVVPPTPSDAEKRKFLSKGRQP